VNLFAWIEATSLAEYVRVSALGYPMMIALHSLGLAIMVGLSVVLSLRVLGFFRAIPFTALQRLLPVAWVGFIVNTLSGSSLFAAQATTYVTDFEFLLKMAFVVVGAVLVGLMQGAISANISAGITTASATSSTLKLFAIGTIIAWTIAMVAGRLIAYL
jgi:hypothetical protein